MQRDGLKGNQSLTEVETIGFRTGTDATELLQIFILDICYWRWFECGV